MGKLKHRKAKVLLLAGLGVGCEETVCHEEIWKTFQYFWNYKCNSTFNSWLVAPLIICDGKEMAYSIRKDNSVPTLGSHHLILLDYMTFVLCKYLCSAPAPHPDGASWSLWKPPKLIGYFCNHNFFFYIFMTIWMGRYLLSWYFLTIIAYCSHCSRDILI